MKLDLKEFEEKLEAEIQALEGVSSMELVPVLCKRSSHYEGFRRYSALVLSFVSFVAAVYFLPWGDYYLWKLLLSVLVFFFVYFFVSWKNLLFFFVPQRILHQKALARAQEVFLSEEVFLTRDRTGVLLFVSLFEKSVILLADKGFQKKIPEEAWKNLAADLARDFNRGQPGTVFIKAIDELVKKWAPEFPVRSDDTNELSNHLRKI